MSEIIAEKEKEFLEEKKSKKGTKNQKNSNKKNQGKSKETSNSKTKSKNKVKAEEKTKANVEAKTNVKKNNVTNITGKETTFDKKDAKSKNKINKKEIEEIKEIVEEKEKEAVNKEIKNENNTIKNGIKKEEEQSKFKIKNILKNKKIITSMYVLLISLIIFCVFILINMLNKDNTKIAKGISINGIDVSNLTQAEAIEVINSNINKEEMQNIKLKYQDYELELVPEQIEIRYDVEEAVNKAYQVGREGNIFTNNFNIIKTRIQKKNIDIFISVNEEKLNEVVNNIQANIPGSVVESTYSIEGENLIISKGKKGIAVNYEELRDMIIEYENNISRTEAEEIIIPVYDKDPRDINLEQIYSEIHREAKDAYYVEEPFQIFPHVLGIDFKISMEEAKQILQQDQEQYTIPLKITTPNITTDKLGSKAFPDLLGRYTTTYASSSANRKFNIARAAGSINGKTLMPGDVFSYNKAIGNPSQSNGYRLATGFANGKHVDSYGGGVCQVSSTLYNAVLYANLDIVSRANHSLPVGYVPVSRDATVYYGGVDFKFKNNRKYPIKIVATTTGSSITVDIYGRKEEKDPEVVIESWITSSIPYSVKYTDNPGLTQGTERVITKGSNGYRSVAYKTLKQNGVVISRTLLSSDTYGPENREIERGTGVVQTPAVVEEIPAPVQEQPQEPTPTPTPVPNPEPAQNTDNDQSVTITP